MNSLVVNIPDTAIERTESQPPPHSIDAEQAVLCVCLLNDEARRHAMNILKPQHFYLKDHSIIFDAMVRLSTTDKPIDAVTVFLELKAMNALEEMGGQPYIMQLMSHIPIVGNVKHYAEKVRDFAGLRAAITVGRKVILRAYEPGAKAGPILRTAARFMDDVARRIESNDGRDGGSTELSTYDASVREGRSKNLLFAGARELSKSSKALVPASLVIIGGAPGDGKSFWMHQSIIEWIEQGVRCAVAMLEKTRAWHLNRARAIMAENGDLADEEYAEKHPDVIASVTERHSMLIEEVGRVIYSANQIDTTLPGVAAWIDNQAENSEIVIVDPITSALVSGGNRSHEDQAFVNSVIRTMERTGCRVVLITHPGAAEKTGPPTLDWICGGKAYQRNCDCVMYVEKFDLKRFMVNKNFGPLEVEANRKVTVLKGRNSRNDKFKMAMMFDHRTVTYAEQGVIQKELKNEED